MARDAFQQGLKELAFVDGQNVPWARIDHAGLIWLLGGHKIVALTADTAVIETARRAADLSSSGDRSGPSSTRVGIGMTMCAPRIDEHIVRRVGSCRYEAHQW